MHKAMSGLAKRTLEAAVKRASHSYVSSSGGGGGGSARDNYSAAHFKYADKWQ